MAVTVDAGTPEVASLLADSVATALDHGTHLHPDLRFVERDGELSAICDAATTDDRPLIVLPRDLLLPVSQVTWADSARRLDLVADPAGLSAAQRELMDLHVALYNACDKVRSLRQTHPVLTLREAPAVIDSIRTLRPQFETSTDPVAVFWMTRTLGVEKPDAHNERVRFLMPLIDLLNHDPRVSGFRLGEQSLTIALNRAPDGPECYVNYGGFRDTMDLALGYGYLDTATAFVHCPPVQVGIDAVGTLTIQGRTRRMRPLAPSPVSPTEDGLVLEYVMFTADQPRWRVPLRMAVQARAMRAGVPAARAEEIASTVPLLLLEAAITRLSETARCAGQYAQTNAGARLVAEAASRQVSLLRAMAEIPG